MRADKVKEEITGKDKRKFLTFLVFLLISVALWFLIKLTKDYTTQTDFTVVYTDVPVNKWISTSDQRVKLSFVADGFVTLRHNLVRPQNRVVTISLKEMPYRLEGGNTYSYGAQYVAEGVADWIGISSSNVTMNDDKLFFNMEELQQKELPVEVSLKVETRRQYFIYGSPQIEPSTVTVYGPQRVLDTMKAVYTAAFRATDASGKITQTLPIDFNEGVVRSDQPTVEVTVRVEQYTEVDYEVPVEVTDTLKCSLYPEKIKVKCLVPICDGPSITPTSFTILADTAQLHARRPTLDVKLVRVPPYVQVIKIDKEEVELLSFEGER